MTEPRYPDQELADAQAENATLRRRLDHLEADVTEHDALVERLRRENLLLLDRLREADVPNYVAVLEHVSRTEDILS